MMSRLCRTVLYHEYDNIMENLDPHGEPDDLDENTIWVRTRHGYYVRVLYVEPGIIRLSHLTPELVDQLDDNVWKQTVLGTSAKSCTFDSRRLKILDTNQILDLLKKGFYMNQSGELESSVELLEHCAYTREYLAEMFDDATSRLICNECLGFPVDVTAEQYIEIAKFDRHSVENSAKMKAISDLNGKRKPNEKLHMRKRRKTGQTSYAETLCVIFFFKEFCG